MNAEAEITARGWQILTDDCRPPLYMARQGGWRTPWLANLEAVLAWIRGRTA